MATMLSKEKLIEILNDWNLWDKQKPQVIDRSLYAPQFNSGRTINKPIAVVGLRRVGKTYCLFNEMLKLGVEKKQILYVNFEDNRFDNNLNSSLLDAILESYKFYVNPNKEVYLFLDEVQNVENWAKWVRTNMDLNKVKKIYLTGSSAKLLSGEFATSLGGRYIEIKIHPLAFNEYLSFKGIKGPVESLQNNGGILQNYEFNNIFDISKNRLGYLKLFEEYLKMGGFPEVVSAKDEIYRKQIIDSYLDTIIYKDIAARYNLKDSSKLKLLLKYLLTNDTKKTNINAMSLATGLSYNTVEEYLSFLKEVYLVQELYEYNYSLKKQYKKEIKYYCSDVSFVNNYAFKFSENRGRLLENVVFNWLIRNKKEVFFYSNNSVECDFLVVDKNKPSELVQVAWELNINSKEREVVGLLFAMEKFNIKMGYIITFDQEDEFIMDDKKIKVVPAWKWMLGASD
jgi:predicted AAA+ superfamily ATPase